MKKITVFLILFFSINILRSQDSKPSTEVIVQTISRENFIGQKIKFLSIDSDDHYSTYWKFSNDIYFSTTLEYVKYKGRFATFIKKEGNQYTLKMDDNNELIYYYCDPQRQISENIGYVSLLQEAQRKYLNKTMYDDELNECKILKIEFAENFVKYDRRFCPYNVYYIVKNKTLMRNVFISETYGESNRHQYYDKKPRVFEEIFTFTNPKAQVTKENIQDKFLTSNDKFEATQTYINKAFVDKNLSENLSTPKVRYLETGIYANIIVEKDTPQLHIISNYHNKNWIFHSNVKIHINGITKETSGIEGNREVLKNNSILETNIYKSNESLDLLKWVSENYTQEVSVRFIGKNYYEDLVLSDAIKLAMKETYDLYLLLKLN